MTKMIDTDIATIECDEKQEYHERIAFWYNEGFKMVSSGIIVIDNKKYYWANMVKEI